MKIVNKMLNQNIPVVVIDKSLDELQDKIMFPEKLEKANKMLSKAKLPKKKHYK